VFFVFFPAATRKVATNDTFNRQGLGLEREHAAPFQLITVLVGNRWELVDVGRNQVVGYQVSHLIKPEL